MRLSACDAIQGPSASWGLDGVQAIFCLRTSHSPKRCSVPSAGLEVPLPRPVSPAGLYRQDSVVPNAWVLLLMPVALLHYATACLDRSNLAYARCVSPSTRGEIYLQSPGFFSRFCDIFGMTFYRGESIKHCKAHGDIMSCPPHPHDPALACSEGGTLLEISRGGPIAWTSREKKNSRALGSPLSKGRLSANPGQSDPKMQHLSCTTHSRTKVCVSDNDVENMAP